MSGRRLGLTGLSAALALVLACSRQPATVTAPTAQQAAAAGTDAAADGSTLKATAPTPQSPINDQQIVDSPTLAATAATMKFGANVGALQYRFQVFNEAGAMAQDSGLMGGPSFKVTSILEFKKRNTWRVRAEAAGMVGPWSSTASFITPDGGYIRGNELFDPLYNGQTVGERIGATTFISGQGLRLENSQSYVRYRIPQNTPTGEFSMEVLGLRANAEGNKSKVFAMSSNGDDFITDPYRVDIQYRGTTGSPPNAITFRALYGSADDLDKRYEPDFGTRNASVFNLNPNTVYLWKAIWGSEFRVQVFEGGIGGRLIYNVGIRSPNGTYTPVPFFAYLGAPTGRSGAEAASIPQTIFRNVWLGARPRP